MKIGEVSERLGLPASTIRYYEQEGLIDPPHRVSGKREFDEKTVGLLEFIQLCQAAGFSLQDIRTLVQSYLSDPGRGSIWRDIALKQQATIREQIQDLQRTEAILSELVACRCATIADCVRIGSQRHLGKRHAKR